MHQNLLDIETDAKSSIAYDVPYIEFGMAVDSAMSKASPRLLASHLPYQHLSHYVTDKKVKMIHVRREIKDTLTSYYHFHQTNPFLHHYAGTFEDFFAMFKDKELIYGDPLTYNEEWLKASKLDYILCLSYEEMKGDLQSVIRNIAAFLNISITDDIVERITQAVAMDKMKTNTYTNMANVYEDHGMKDFNINKFYRKGIVGDWKGHFNSEQLAYIENRIKETK